MMHKAWCSIEEVSYCFSRSSIKFQSHAGLEITRSFEMMHNAWLTWNAWILLSANRERPLNLNHSLMWIVWVAPVPLIIFQSNSTFDEKLQYHYKDVLMGAIASQITSLTMLTQPIIQTQIKENIKASHDWPLCGEFTGDRWIPRTNGQLRGKCFHLMTSSCTGLTCATFRGDRANMLWTGALQNFTVPNSWWCEG